MTHQQRDEKKAYNHYCEFIVTCNPFIHTQDSYNHIVTGFIEKLSSDFLLHTRDKLPIISLKDAQRLWKEVDAGYFVWVLDKPFYAPTHKKIDRVNIENYLFLEHREILKKLEQADPKKPGGTTANEPQDAAGRPQGKNKRKANKLFYTFDEKNRIELSFNRKDKPVTLTEQEMKLFQYLNKDRRTPDEIIGYIWNVYERKDLYMKRKNVKELRVRLNKRCSEIGVETAISKLIDGYYSLTVEAVER